MFGSRPNWEYNEEADYSCTDGRKSARCGRYAVQDPGDDNGDRNCEVVQPDQRLRLHSAVGRRKRRVRSRIGGGARRLELAQRGPEGRVRTRQQPRQDLGGESQGEVTASAGTLAGLGGKRRVPSEKLPRRRMATSR